MLKVKMVTGFLCFISFSGLSQNPLPDPSETIQSIVESLEEYDRLPEDFTDMLDNLEQFRENPLNLNQAGREDLEKFIFLTDFQIKSLLDHRKDHGPFLSPFELQLVIGFDSLTAACLLPFVRAGEMLTDNRLVLKNVVTRGKHEIIVKEQRILQTPEGYREVPDSIPAEEAGTRYPGSRDRLLVKYRYHYQKRLLCGVTMEKDAGEEFFTGSNRHGFDFYSGYIQINDLGPVKSLLLGDYQVTAGQGLTLWAGPAFGKSLFPPALYKREALLKKYGSTDESLFFRGIALSVTVKRITCLAFFSSKHMDANITDTLLSGAKVFSTFQESGYHRTPAEISDENAISETAAGVSAIYRNNWLKVGSTIAGYTFSGLKEEPDDLFRKYEFHGDHLVNAGLDYSLFFRKIQFYGETSWGNRAFATINGAILTPHQQITFSLLQRYYDPQYFARYTGAVSENSGPGNENAFYMGTVIQPFRFWKITSYADFFRFPWLTYSLRQPTSGSELFVQTDFTPVRSLMFYFRFRSKSSMANFKSDATPLEHTEIKNNNTFRLHCRYQVNRGLQLQSRVEFKTVVGDSSGKADGFLLYQDVVYRFAGIPVQVSLRYALYRTDGYAARIYAYENDVLYSYSIPVLYDEGNRSYVMVRYDACKNLTWWVRWGQTLMEDAMTLGSGLDEIPGNKRSEIKLQVRWVF